jgi:hypothetical protein
LHELEPWRDFHVFVGVGNNNLLRRRVAKEAVKARGMVHIFVGNPEVAGRRFVTRSPGTNRRRKNDPSVIGQIGLLIGQIYLNGALAKAAHSPGEDPTEN